MAALGFKDVITATDGQTKFKTSQPFIEKDLNVFLNGVLMNEGDSNDYAVVDSLHINFTYPLVAGDIVVMSNTMKNENLDVEVVGFKNSLFNIFGTEVLLKNNNLYKLQLRIGGKDHSLSFSSKYSPLLTTAVKVRSLTGDLLKDVSNEKINYMLYQNSKEITERTKLLTVADKPYLNTNKINWVLYKTCMDFINAIYLTMSGQVGSVSKTIGPVTVDKTLKIPFIEDMLKRFKSSFDKAETYLSSSDFTAKGFVKAGKTAYPYMPRVDF